MNRGAESAATRPDGQRLPMKKDLLAMEGTGPSAFFSWRSRIGPELQKMHGPVAKFANCPSLMADRYEAPAVVSEDYAPAGVQLTAAHRAILMLDALKMRNRVVKELKDKEVTLYGALQTEISDTSWSIIKGHEDFQVAVDRPDLLWTYNVRTHVTEKKVHDAHSRPCLLSTPPSHHDS